MKFLIALTFVVACSSHPEQLSDKAKNLEVFPSKPTGCNVVGKVVGMNKSGSKELALNHALNQAADKGASGIFVNQEVPNGSVMNVYATAYKCE